MAQAGKASLKPSSGQGLQNNIHNRAPLYHQIFLILRSRILDGQYGPGDYLPGERELETMFQVSRITAVRALNELAAAGLVVRERGRGTRVQFVGSGIVSRGPTGSRGESSNVLSGTPHEVFNWLHSGGKSQVKVFEFDYVVPPAGVAAALKLQPGERAQYASRVWRFEKLPFNFVNTYVPEDIGQGWTRKDLESLPLGELLDQAGVNVHLVQERVTATLADALLSERLDINLGSPVLKIDRTAFSTEGRPVEHLIGFYPPERYQYEVTLPRQNASGRGRQRNEP
jgi:GntR family transcriptional regulator